MSKRTDYTKRIREQRIAAKICTTCGKSESRLGKRTCQKCADLHGKLHKAREIRLISAGKCRYCGLDNEIGYTACSKCRKASKEYSKILTSNTKRSCLTAYGGIFCSCCGIAELGLLTLDHIEGGGSKHRREIGIDGGYRFYQHLAKLNYPPGYRVLCWNCNASSFQNSGICYHKLKST